MLKLFQHNKTLYEAMKMGFYCWLTTQRHVCLLMCLKKEFWYVTFSLFPSLEEWSAASANSHLVQGVACSNILCFAPVFHPLPWITVKAEVHESTGKCYWRGIVLAFIFFFFFLFNLLYFSVPLPVGVGKGRVGRHLCFALRVELPLSSGLRNRLWVSCESSRVMSGLWTL